MISCTDCKGSNYISNDSYSLKMNLVANAIKRISIVAFTIFGLFTVPKLFILGLTLGTAYELTLISLKLSPRQQGDTKPLCAQGYVEDYLGRKALPFETEAVKAAFFFACHLAICPTLTCPIFGFLVGGRIAGVVDSIKTELMIR